MNVLQDIIETHFCQHVRDCIDQHERYNYCKLDNFEDQQSQKEAQSDSKDSKLLASEEMQDEMGDESKESKVKYFPEIDSSHTPFNYKVFTI